MKKVIAVAVVIILALSMVFVYVNFGEQTVQGSKNVTIEVVSQSKESVKYTVNTDSLYLKEVMEEADGLEFTITDGMIITVNGELAEYNTNGAYWALFVNGEYGSYGAEKQPVNDGDVFGIVYTAA